MAWSDAPTVHSGWCQAAAKGKNMERKSLQIFTLGLLFGLVSSFLKAQDYKQQVHTRHYNDNLTNTVSHPLWCWYPQESGHTDSLWQSPLKHQNPEEDFAFLCYFYNLQQEWSEDDSTQSEQALLEKQINLLGETNINSKVQLCTETLEEKWIQW